MLTSVCFSTLLPIVSWKVPHSICPHTFSARHTQMTLNVAPNSIVSFCVSASNPPLKILERRWPCSSSDPSAAVLLLHGYTWHSAWFNELATDLAKNGNSIVHSIDFLSHGESDSIFDTRGLFRDFDDFVDDAEAALHRLRLAAPSVPIFVLGESMGGTVALLLALRKEIGSTISGLVLCGAALQLTEAVQPSWPVIQIAKVIGKFFPTLPVPGDEISGESWDEAFGDPEARKLSKEDPLVNYGEPLRMGAARAHFNAIPGLSDRMKELEVGALLAMHYIDDTRVSFSAVDDALRKIEKVKKKQMVPFRGNAHQLFQDVPEIRRKAIKTVVNFVLENSIPRL